jgi:integrase
MRITRQPQVLTAQPGRRKKDGQPCAGRHNADPGLYLIVSADGRSRRWAFRYTKRTTGKPTEHGLGSADVLTLAEARDKAHECRKAVAKGEDPIEKKREERRAKTTFAEMVTAFLGLKESEWRTQKHGEDIRRLLTNHAGPLATKSVSSITADDIEAALRPLWTRSSDQGKRTLSAIGRVFDYAMAHGHCVANPADWRRMKYRFPNHRAAVKHFAAMDYIKVPEFVRQLHIEQERNTALSPYVIEFLLLTACRANEVIRMQWVEVDFDAKVWVVPASRTKVGREHRVPLADRALELLAERRLRTNSDFVWQSHRSDGPINKKAVYLYLTKTMSLRALATLHGLRSTFRDWAGNETHFDRVACELALGHKAGDATELAYRRSDALEKRRALMDAWASFCR